MQNVVLFAAGYALGGFCIGALTTLGCLRYRDRRRVYFACVAASSSGDTLALKGYRSDNIVALTACPQSDVVVLGTTRSEPIALDQLQAYRLGQALDNWVSRRSLGTEEDFRGD